MSLSLRLLLCNVVISDRRTGREAPIYTNNNIRKWSNLFKIDLRFYLNTDVKSTTTPKSINNNSNNSQRHGARAWACRFDRSRTVLTFLSFLANSIALDAQDWIVTQRIHISVVSNWHLGTKVQLVRPVEETGHCDFDKDAESTIQYHIFITTNNAGY